MAAYEKRQKLKTLGLIVLFSIGVLAAIAVPYVVNKLIH